MLSYQGSANYNQVPTCSEVLKAIGALKPTGRNAKWHNHLGKEFGSFL